MFILDKNAIEGFAFLNTAFLIVDYFFAGALDRFTQL
jgi:hypothetical protein